MNIYVHKDGTQYGPYTLEQLQQYLQQGSFTLQDQACHDGQNWVTIAQVPGIAQAATPPSQPAAQQAQTIAPKQAAAKKAVAAKTKHTAAASNQAGQQKTQKSGKGGSKVLFIAGGLVILLVGLIGGLCYVLFSGDDEAKDKENLVADSDETTDNEPSSDEEISEETPSSSAPSTKSANIPLIERVPADAGAVILIRVNDLLEKGREDIAALLPPGLPPMVGKALEDPSSLGLDVSEPLQIHLIANENTNLAPTGGLAGKLSDPEKFMTTLELLAGLETPEQKDGYLLYQPLGGADGSEPQIAIGSDFFFAGGADKPSDREPSIDKFMTADGSSSLSKNNDSFVAFSKESHDLSIWFGGDSILETIGNQLDNASLDSIEGGSGIISLNFENGEMIAQMKVDTPKMNWFTEKEDFLMES